MPRPLTARHIMAGTQNQQPNLTIWPAVKHLPHPTTYLETGGRRRSSAELGFQPLLLKTRCDKVRSFLFQQVYQQAQLGTIEEALQGLGIIQGLHLQAEVDELSLRIYMLYLGEWE